MAFDLPLDYIDVATRIVAFREKHPDGALQQVSLDFREVAGSWWVIYTAAAYRSPDDARPGHGTAWEPIPGRTPFTKGSEVQNAETAAWGRAIVAVLAGDTKKGVASAEEVRNAQAAQAPPDPVMVVRGRIKDAWEAGHGGAFDRDAMFDDLTSQMGIPENVEPSLGQLITYAELLEGKP